MDTDGELTQGAGRPPAVSGGRRGRGGTPAMALHTHVQHREYESEKKHGLSTEQFPVSAYIGSSKDLKDLKDLRETQPSCSRGCGGTATPRARCSRSAACRTPPPQAARAACASRSSPPHAGHLAACFGLFGERFSDTRAARRDMFVDLSNNQRRTTATPAPFGPQLSVGKECVPSLPTERPPSVGAQPLQRGEGA